MGKTVGKDYFYKAGAYATGLKKNGRWKTYKW